MARRWSVLIGCAFAACAPQPVEHGQRRDELRPTDTSAQQMYRFEPSEQVGRFGLDGGHFAVHFSHSGRNATIARDANDSGVPDFVEEVAAVYEDVASQYQRWGFREPLRDGALASNGGDDRFDVYLLDFGGSADGAFRTDTCLAPSGERCVGFMVQENDFVEANYPSTAEATRILGSHEFFHAVQAAYDSSQDSNVSEGTAVWATEEYDPASSDFENFIGSFLRTPERSLDAVTAGPIPASAYGSALFFRFLSERHGAVVIRELWEHLENGSAHPLEPQANPTWLVQLDAVLRGAHGSTLATELETFAMWNLTTGTAADATKAYREGARYPAPAMTQVTAPVKQSLRSFYASTQYFRASTAGRASMTAALLDSSDAGVETRGMKIVAVTRRGGRNVDARAIGAPFDTSAADELIVAVVNTNRGPDGATLSRRPTLCVGTPAEVASCSGETVDAGVIEPISVPGVQPSLPAAPAGCSHEIAAIPSPLLLLLSFLRRRRKP